MGINPSTPKRLGSKRGKIEATTPIGIYLPTSTYLKLPR